MASESAIVNNIKKYLKTLKNCYFYKTHGDLYTENGHADITGCLKGRRFEIEVKQPGEKPTVIQKVIMRKWKRAGAITGVVESAADVEKLLAPYL